MSGQETFGQNVEAILASSTAKLRGLSYEQAKALPETTSEDRMVGPYKCAVSTFHQQIENDRHLLTVQIARRRLFGLFSQHWERGVIYAPQEAPREATAEELQNHGG